MHRHSQHLSHRPGVAQARPQASYCVKAVILDWMDYSYERTLTLSLYDIQACNSVIELFRTSRQFKQFLLHEREIITRMPSTAFGVSSHRHSHVMIVRY